MKDEMRFFFREEKEGERKFYFFFASPFFGDLNII